MSIKALIWDWEGVLLLSKDGSISTSVAKRLGVPQEKLRMFFHGDFNDRVDRGECSQQDYWHHVLDTLQLPRSYVSRFTDFLHQDMYVDQELLERIRQYREKYKTALLSNFSDILRPLLETRWQVDGAFDEIIISWEAKCIKPEPEIFQLTIDRLGCSAQECVLIDDRMVNIDGARQFGMHAVYFENRTQALSEIEDLLKSQNMKTDT